MKRFPLSGVVALFGLVLALPAQHAGHSRFSRFLRGAAEVVQAGHRAHCPPVVPCPPSPRVYRAPRGHWETVHEQVLVPGFWQDQHVPPTYGWITQSCGRRVWGIVDPGGCRRVWVPARWETRCRQVWVTC